MVIFQIILTELPLSQEKVALEKSFKQIVMMTSISQNYNKAFGYATTGCECQHLCKYNMNRYKHFVIIS